MSKRPAKATAHTERLCNFTALQVGRQLVQFGDQARHQLDQSVALLDRCRQLCLQLLQGRLAAVKATVDSSIEMSANNAAACDQKHAVQSNLAVERTQAKIAVVKNE